jgi:hypothetical protein
MRFINLSRISQGLAVMTAGLALAACSNLLEVQFPGRIPATDITDPSLAGVLARSVVSDLECAYNNYSGGSSTQSDEFESSNGNVPGRNWGERTISQDEDDYVLGGCEATGATASYFGMHTTLHTARVQAETIGAQLATWTDAEVPGRADLLATVMTYNGFPYLFMGETFCKVSFDDAGTEHTSTTPQEALTIAESKFADAVTQAQAAGNADMLNLARVGLARAKLDLATGRAGDPATQGGFTGAGATKFAEAAAIAAQVPVNYVKVADRGTESSRRYNKFNFWMTTNGYFVVATALRPGGADADPRMLVFDTGHGAFTPTIESWQTNKYPALGTPIELASGLEARLIQAEALAHTGNVSQAMDLINAGRAEAGLPAINGITTLAAALPVILHERQAVLSFRGGNRLADLLRYGLPWKGANGSTKIANEFDGNLYGASTCWPLPTKQTNGA